MYLCIVYLSVFWSFLLTAACPEHKLFLGFIWLIDENVLFMKLQFITRAQAINESEQNVFIYLFIFALIRLYSPTAWLF